MAEPNFGALRSQLLEGGISPRRVRRLIQELRAHCADLRAEEESSGLDGPAALQAAMRRLGTEDSLAQRFLARRELLSWSRRWPWAVFGIAPPVVCFGAFVLTIIATAGLAGVLKGLKHSEPQELLVLLKAMRILALYAVPALVAAGLAVLALRRHASPGWAALALALAALLGSTTNMSVSLHLIGAGIGWRTRPEMVGRLLLFRWLPIATVASALVGLCVLVVRVRRSRVVNGPAIVPVDTPVD